MKISSKKYAQALYEAVREKEEKEIGSVIERFVKVLHENKDVHKAEAIMKYFEKTWNDRNGITVIDITTATEHKVETIETLKNYISKKLKAENVHIRENIDRNILGGVVFKHRDVVYDGSLRKRLSDLKDKLNN